METFKRLFKRKEHQNEHEFTKEQFVFKHDFKRYYVRHINKVVEFWGRSEIKETENYFIGKLVNEKIILSKVFYTYPYDVQKAGGRLCRIYLHNNWTEI